MATPERIPLFPLNVVLFPGMTLPLHIFEPRYVALLRDCLAGDRSFGVALIRFGEEVGAEAIPCEVGCLATVQRCRPKADGRCDITTTGSRRFHIQRLHHDKPYLEADVGWLAERDIDHPHTQPAMEAASQAFQRYVQLQQQVTGRKAATLVLPDNPAAASYHIAAHAPIGLLNRQSLLETDSCLRRLVNIAQMLQTRNQQQATFLGLRSHLGRLYAEPGPLQDMYVRPN